MKHPAPDAFPKQPQRTPKGVPSGGQFSASQHTESDVTLGSLTEVPFSIVQEQAAKEERLSELMSRLEDGGGDEVDDGQYDDEMDHLRSDLATLNLATGPVVHAMDGRASLDSLLVEYETTYWNDGDRTAESMLSDVMATVRLAEAQRQLAAAQAPDPVPQPLEQPYTREELLALADEDDYVTGYVAVDIEELHSCTGDQAYDLYAQKLTGHDIVQDIAVHPVGATKGGSIVVKVSGDVSDILNLIRPS